jgi:hypothetical protein
MRRIWNVLIDIPRQLKRLGPKRTRAVTERPPAEEAGKPEEPHPPAEAPPSQEIQPKAEEPKKPEEPQPPAEAPRLQSSPPRPGKPRKRKNPDPREGSPG